MVNVVEERIKKWRNKLIDLSKRNRLINFRPTKVTTVRIVDELPPEIFDIIVIKNNTMKFLPLPEDVSTDGEAEREDNKTVNKSKIVTQSQAFHVYDKDGLDEKHTDEYLQTNVPEEQLQKNLLRIYSKATSVMEEQGYNVLFLALGCLEWYESQDSDVKLRAPIILVPVELKRKSVKTKIELRYTEESLMLNPALIQKLANDFGINVPPIEEEIEQINTQAIFKKMQDATSHLKNWRVTNDIYLSLFSFSKFIMYKDLENYMNFLLQNNVVKTICGQKGDEHVALNLLNELGELETNLKPLETFQVLDADSSQQKAILAVKKGSNLLIEGPPGTGKSQTIANIMAECLAEGKKVLFVSQKMAALEVVKKRLEHVGLGDFCLELHSRKANKNEVIKELVRTLEAQKKPDHTHDEELLELEKLRKKLNAYVIELHTSYGNLEMTPYQAFGIVCSHPEISDIGFIFKDIKAFDRKKFHNCCDLLDSLAHNLSKIHNPKQHPWKGVKITEFHYEDKVKLMEFISNIIDMQPDLKGYAEKLAQLTSFKLPSSMNDISNLINATKLLIDSPSSPKVILENQHWNSIGTDVADMLGTVKKFNKFQDETKTKYKINIIESNIKPLLYGYTRNAKNILFLLRPSFWKNRKIIKSYILTGYKPKLKTIKEDLGEIEKGQQLAEKIDKMSRIGKELFGDLWRDRNTKWELIDKFSRWIVEFRQYVVKSYFKNTIFDEISEHKLNSANLKSTSEILFNKLSDLKNLLKLFNELIKLDELEAFGSKIEDASLDNVFQKIVNMQKTMDNLDLWIRYQVSLQDCKEVGIAEFVSKIIAGDFKFTKIVNTFKCQFLRCWLDTVFSEKPTLKVFYGENHQRLIQKFCNIDRKQIELAKIRIRHLLSGKVDSSWEASKNSELGILLRESRKRRAHKPIRKLFQQIPHVIRDLKPCLMMSPLTVAQFIDANLMKFDLIIFDEASQIPPEDSIGCIMRGKQVVIAGDSKQLPPTSFFQSEVITDEDEENELEYLLPTDLDSILDECAVSKFPKLMLQWHYRSRHESLIAFSNKNFYENRLNTFPCAEEENKALGVKFNYIPNTVYDRGGSGKNIEEAKMIAKAVFKHFKEHPDLSLGVGTFSIRQKYAVEDAIEEMLRKDNSLEVFFLKDKFEHFFIKNLEIIQGDERDVIFISIGYGKDTRGRLSMNFGPINKNGGQRRLNVLVTRARYRIEIFSSIRGDDFDLSKTDSQGVHSLKKYLDFAEKGKIVLLQDIEEKIDEFSESPFEEAVYNALTEKGIKVRRQVGCSGYKIDLAVVDSKNPGRYLLGIECDGACYHSCLTARDRDRLRQQVLGDLGWKLHRIWSTDWFRHPQEELEKVLDAINRVKSKEFKKKLPEKTDYVINYTTDSDNKPDNITQGNSIVSYSLAPTRRVGYPEDFYLCTAEKIGNVLQKVVNYEGPIHKHEAMRRVIEHWGMNSVGVRIREQMSYVQSYCVKKRKIKVKGQFYWPIDLKKPAVRIRDSEEVKKDISLIAPEEIGEAALVVLQKEYSMPEDNLVEQTARLLGFRRVTDDISRCISRSIKIYKELNKIVEVDGKFAAKTC